VLFDVSQVIPSERKIAVTGIAGGGKTVFLTSLLSNLIEHDPYQFAFGQQARVSHFKELSVKPGYGGQFRLDAYRDSLARRRQWPAKTVDCAHYQCSFQRSDWRYRKARLHFFDLPGERIADSAIAGHEAFIDWSAHVLRQLEDRLEGQPEALEYLELQRKPGVSVDALVQAYQRLLAAMVFAYQPLIAPSTFLLDTEGVAASAQDPETLARTRTSGLPGGAFAPMSQRLSGQYPELLETMQQRYQAYRETVALPVFEELQGCDGLVVLVDVPSLLLGGVSRYNGNRQSLTDLFEALRPGSWLAARLLSLLGWKTGKLKRVAFVAAKADTVLPQDVQNGRLGSLLRSMTDRAHQLLPSVQFEWFTCSACVCTRPDPTDPTALIGLSAHADKLEEVAFRVSRLPDHWPASWQPGEFQFSRVMPQAPENLQIPPPQRGLDQVFDFLIGS
jgi:predicted YcjX-like family ATPase